MRRLLIILLGALAVCAVVGECCAAQDDDAKVPALQRGVTDRGSDIYFYFGTRLNSVLRQLDEQYPEYRRRVEPLDNGFTDVVDFHKFIFYHYYFKDNRYVGSTTTFHGIDKHNSDYARLFNGLVRNLSKRYGVTPDVDEKGENYEWVDTLGNRAFLEIYETPGDTLILMRTMTEALEREHL